MPKAAILLLADTETHGDLGRAANALTTVREFADNGDDVTLIFDGAGTRWAAEIANEDHRLHPDYAAIRDKVAGACRFCAGAFEVREDSSRTASRSSTTTSGTRACARSSPTATR
jgi:hypothetical protein